MARRLRRGAALALVVFGGSCCGLLLAEGAARLLESPPAVQGNDEPLDDPELGWVPRPGRSTVTSDEYVATYHVDSRGLNDGPERSGTPPRRRLLALGDSHTFAVGVSWDESWPNVLERELFGTSGEGAVDNAGVAAYSLGQCLLRMRRLIGVPKPELVVLGFSMATDLYDLIPPSHGGFVFLADRGRAYFDLDAAGALREHRELVGVSGLPPSPGATTLSLRLRSWLDRTALYRRLKSSSVALRVSSVVRPGGASLWPGPDTAMRRQLGAEDTYRWALAGALLRRMAAEADAAGAHLVVVNLPYLPQVYDEVWEASFGRRPEEYDRWVAGERLARLCREAGMTFVDTTPRFIEEARRTGRWLHYRRDKHPTPEGHRLIARVTQSALEEGGLLE